MRFNRFNYNNYYNNYNYYYSDNKIVIHCVKCLGKLKVPVDKGKIMVTCPLCKKEFLFNPNSILDTIKQIFLSMIAWLKSAKTKLPYMKSRISCLKYRLKSYRNSTSNKKSLIFMAIIILLILVLFILSLFKKPKNTINITPNIPSGPTVITEILGNIYNYV